MGLAAHWGSGAWALEALICDGLSMEGTQRFDLAHSIPRHQVVTPCYDLGMTTERRLLES
jgi:hypothetical protein